MKLYLTKKTFTWERIMNIKAMIDINLYQYLYVTEKIIR